VLIEEKRRFLWNFTRNIPRACVIFLLLRVN